MNLQLDHYWKSFLFRKHFYNNQFRVSDLIADPSKALLAVDKRLNHTVSGIVGGTSSLCSPVGLSKGSVPSWHSQGTNRAKNNAFTLVLYLALLTLVVGCQKQWINFTLYAIIRHQPQLYNIVQWITRLGGRWRTQLTARRNVNCRIYEHRHFERILRNGACRLSMSGSGSVIHPSQIVELLQYLYCWQPSILALSSRCSLDYSVALRFVALKSVARADSLDLFLS